MPQAMPFRFDSLERIRKISCPIMMVHGKKDSVVPYRMSENLEAAVRAPLTRLDISTAGHSDLFTKGGERLWHAIYEFIDHLPGIQEEAPVPSRARR